MITLGDNKKCKHISFTGHLAHVIWALVSEQADKREKNIVQVYNMIIQSYNAHINKV